MEHASPELIHLLAELKLAAPRDWQRAARVCQLLACDLPTFDNVWIDALLRLRCLTPFQAGLLRDNRGDELRVGRFVLTALLGSNGVDSMTYAAKPIGGADFFALKILGTKANRLNNSVQRASDLIEAVRGCQPDHAFAPFEAFNHADGLVFVSPLAPGNDIRSVLLRGGSLPAGVVSEIGATLCAILRVYHSAGLVHGDIRLENIRLSPRGDVSLVDFGVRSCRTASLSVHGEHDPEWYEGTAPELIGTSAAPTIASDVYALGCALWHMTAGRAPFPLGDRLAVLSAHRTKQVPCIHDYAANVPSEVSRVLEEMTAFNAADRPTDLASVQNRLSRRRGLRGSKPTTSTRSSAAFSWTTAAVMLFALSGLAIFFVDQHAAMTFLAFPTPKAVASNTGKRLPSETQQNPAKLPAPDLKGVIELGHAGPFAAADISFKGPLILRGNSSNPATILITDEPLHLWADEVTLENVRLTTKPPQPSAGLAALALIESQTLTIRSCRFESAFNREGKRSTGPAAVAWRSIDRADPTAGHISITNTVARNVREMLYLADSARQVTLSNTLSVGAHSLLKFIAPSRMVTEVELSQSTLRDVSTVISAGSSKGPTAINVTATDCVLDLNDGVLFSKRADSQCDLRWRGDAVVTNSEIHISPQAKLVRDAAADPEHEANALEPESGIVVGKVEFRGAATGSDAASLARIAGVPRRADRPLGFDLSRLPGQDTAVAD